MTWEEKNTLKKYIITGLVSFIPELLFSWVIGKILTESMWYVWIALQIVKVFLWILRSAVAYILWHLVWTNGLIDSTYCSFVQHQYPNPRKYTLQGLAYTGSDYFSDVMNDDEIKIETRLDASNAKGVLTSLATTQGFWGAMRMENVIMRAIDKYHRVNFSGADYQPNPDED